MRPPEASGATGGDSLAPEEARALAFAILRRPCPECGDTQRPVNAGVIAKATGAVIAGHYEERVLVACDRCRARHARRAIAWTAAFGWWSLFGFVQAAGAIWQDAQTLRACERRQKPTPALLRYIEAHPEDARRLARGEGVAPEASGG